MPKISAKLIECCSFKIKVDIQSFKISIAPLIIFLDKDSSNPIHNGNRTKESDNLDVIGILFIEVEKVKPIGDE